jgi:mannose-1-phosphate guanylyltransferase
VSAPIAKAFLLGAGLGTRLRPLTEALPKPLIPVFHRPLIHHALDHCLAAGIKEFAINTHHLPEKWDELFPTGEYRGAPLTFFHEPTLLETGGGIKNIEDWIGEDSILVYNGDILTTLDLDRLLATHTNLDRSVTLAIRSTGHALHIAVHDDQVTDIHQMLEVAPGTHQFTGLYCIDPGFLSRIPPHEKISVIPAFLELAREQLLGASIRDEGIWLDLGSRESYLNAHLQQGLGGALHPEAHLHSTAMVEDSAIGPGASIGADAAVLNTILWPNAQVESGAQLTNCIVYTSIPVSGAHHNADL